MKLVMGRQRDTKTKIGYLLPLRNGELKPPQAICVNFGKSRAVLM